MSRLAYEAPSEQILVLHAVAEHRLPAGRVALASASATDRKPLVVGVLGVTAAS